MSPRLTKDFKIKATEFILNRSKQIIQENFDKNEQCKKNVEIDDETVNAVIYRNCFPKTQLMPYFEDYQVIFTTTIDNQKIFALFYLEWNATNTELIPANRVWNPVTGKCSNRTIKIRKCK